MYVSNNGFVFRVRSANASLGHCIENILQFVLSFSQRILGSFPGDTDPCNKTQIYLETSKIQKLFLKMATTLWVPSASYHTYSGFPLPLGMSLEAVLVSSRGSVVIARCVGL